MFLLGHSCWSYLTSKFIGRQLGVDLPLYLALLSGVLPDFDIYFHPLIQHHTITHSILFLGPITVILMYRYRLLGAAFGVGLLSHLLTDSLVGTIPILYPISGLVIGLDLGIPGPVDTSLEMGALVLAFLYAMRNDDYKQFLHRRKESLPVIIPLVSIVTLSLLFVSDNNISLTTLAFSRKALTLITLGHAILLSTLTVGALQGLRGHMAEWKRTRSPVQSPP